MGARACRRSFAGRLVAAVLGVGLVGASPQTAWPSELAHAQAPKPASAKKPAAAATVLELDSDDNVLAGRLGQSLRRAFAQRGLDDGRRDSLAELRLAMGCKKDEPACLARGGRALGVKTMIFGSLRATKTGTTLVLSVLAVESASIESSVRVELEDSDLGEASIDDTAERVVSELLGEAVVPEPSEPVVQAPSASPRTTPAIEAKPSPPPPPEPSTSTSTSTSLPADRGKRNSKFWWGLEKPTPKWKWAAFGTSAGLLVASSTAAIALVASMGRLRDRLIQTANDSLVDEYPSGSPNAGQPYTLNDVDPAHEADICAAAREHPPEDMQNPESVRNKKVVEVCNRGDGLEKGAFATFAVVGVSLAATLVFTGLLLIHRREPRTNARARHRVLPSFGASGQGVGASLSGRF